MGPWTSVPGEFSLQCFGTLSKRLVSISLQLTVMRVRLQGSGWKMVDGSTVPIFAQPHHFGNSFFDCKHRYSMNVQIISSPTLDILDYGVSLSGSQHDVTAWQLMQLIEEHGMWLGEGEWV